jgi:uncharacterized protein (DUF885 family)
MTQGLLEGDSEKGFVAAVFAMEGNFNQLRSVAQPDDNTTSLSSSSSPTTSKEFSPEFFLSLSLATATTAATP